MTQRNFLPVNDVWTPAATPKAHVVSDSRYARERRRFGFTTAMNESLILSLFRVPRHFVGRLFTVWFNWVIY